MILKDPKKATGHKIRYFTWKKRYMIVESISGEYIFGILVDKNGNRTKTKYNLCEGITTGKQLNEYWHIIDYKQFDSLPDELFEI
jgi:hypothetical protein